MKRMHKWLLGIGITLVVLIGVSVAALYVGTNMVLQTLMPEFEESPFDGQAGSEKVTDESSTEPQQTDPDKERSDAGSADEADFTPAAPADAVDSAETAEPSADPSARNPSADEASSEQPNNVPDANKETVQPIEEDSDSEKQGRDSFEYSAEITEEKQAAVRENITFGERLKLMTTLGKNLSTEEISYFMKLAQGGLTIEEKREAKKIMLEKLTEKEYNELIAIAAKYGLSQGKGYVEGRVQVGLD